MASVQQLKDGLEAKNEQAIKVVEVAMTAIDTMLNLSIYGLGFLTLLIALVATVGWWELRRVIRTKAEQIADKKLDEHLASDDFEADLSRRVAEAIAERMENAVVVREIEQRQREPADPVPFPEPERDNDPR